MLNLDLAAARSLRAAGRDLAASAAGPASFSGGLAAEAHGLADRLLGALLTGSASVLAGLICAHLLRARGLRWSWALLALGAVALLRSALGGLAPALTIVAFVATVRARRRQREDTDAGADLAAAAARRIGPAGVLRRLLLARFALPRRRRDGWFRGDELIIGCDRRGALVSVPFGGAGGGTHTLIVGATGSGKTVTETWTAVHAAERGMGVVVIDPKGDARMRAALAAAAERRGEALIEWTPDGPSVYNPFARGGETEIADKLLAGESFSEPHYQRQAQRYLGHVVRALRRAGFEVGLHAVVHHLDPVALEQLVRALPARDADPTRRYLESLSARQLADLSGVRDRLAILAESDVGRWLDPSCPAATRFDLRRAIADRAIVYFDLAADSRPLLAQMLGAAIVQDLTTTVAAMQHSPLATAVVIDEFASLAAEHVVRLFARARSAGVSVVLATQELADLRLPGRDALVDQVLGNLTTLVAHRQVVPSSAERVAELGGVVGAWRSSRRDDGRVTRTRVREHALGAGDVMRLAPGVAATIVLDRDTRARLTRIFAIEQEVPR